MKILITGYRGFIGQNMVKALKDKHDLSFFEWGENLPNFKNLDWCIHLGAESSTSETDVEKVLNKNYDFSRYVINECQKYNVNLQYASSAAVYGNNSTFAENSKVDPKSPYAWSKCLFDRYVVGLSERWTIRVQGFRYFNVYGPHEDHKVQPSPFYKFDKEAKETGIIKLFEGSKNFKRDFVPVERVIEVHEKMMNINATDIWNLGTGSPRSFEEIALEIANKYNAKIEYIPIPDHLKNQYQAYTCADLTKLNSTLGL